MDRRYRFEKIQKKNMKELAYEGTDKQKKRFLSELYHQIVTD